MSPLLLEALHETDVLARVERRLMADGAFVELDVLRGMSVDELEVLVMRETGAGNSVGEAE